jgi:hypothetical protein
MRFSLVLSAVVAVGGCSVAPTADAAREKSSATPSWTFPVCDQTACSAAGGQCVNHFCVDGCENPPVSCTEKSAGLDPNDHAKGAVDITCAGNGNGFYSVAFTKAEASQGPFGSAPPAVDDKDWVPYPNTNGDPWCNTVFNGRQLFMSCAVDSNDWCQYPDCQFIPTYVRVCAEPGTPPFTAQNRICTNANLENPPQRCVVLAVPKVDSN